jgi:hypothetical protein
MTKDLSEHSEAQHQLAVVLAYSGENFISGEAGEPGTPASEFGIGVEKANGKNVQRRTELLSGAEACCLVGLCSLAVQFTKDRWEMFSKCDDSSSECDRQEGQDA